MTGERRRSARLKDFNEITTTVISDDTNLSKENTFYNLSEDLSLSGAKIRGNRFLPVDTLLKIDFKLKHLQEKITATAKIKWIRNVFEDKWYEAGVEFIHIQDEVLKTLDHYISYRQHLMSLNAIDIPVDLFETFQNRNVNH